MKEMKESLIHSQSLTPRVAHDGVKKNNTFIYICVYILRVCNLDLKDRCQKSSLIKRQFMFLDV